MTLRSKKPEKKSSGKKKLTSGDNTERLPQGIKKLMKSSVNRKKKKSQRKKDDPEREGGEKGGGEVLGNGAEITVQK